MTWAAWLHLFFPQPVPVQLAEAQLEIKRQQVDIEVLELRCDELALLNEQLRQHLLANVAVARQCVLVYGGVTGETDQKQALENRARG